MKNLITAIIVSTGFATGAAQADDALLKKYNCVACHANNAKKVGPAYNEVAKKYASKGDAVAYLSGKIKAGGKGVWGPIPMPPHPQVSDADAKTLATYILTIK